MCTNRVHHKKSSFVLSVQICLLLHQITIHPPFLLNLCINELPYITLPTYTYNTHNNYCLHNTCKSHIHLLGTLTFFSIHFPLKMTIGGNIWPSAVAGRTTVRWHFSTPVVLIVMVFSPLLSTDVLLPCQSTWEFHSCCLLP